MNYPSTFLVSMFMAKRMIKRSIVLLLLTLPMLINAAVSEYSLVIEKKHITVSGKTVEKIAINGTIPGPVLHLTQSDEAVIHVTNQLKEYTSIHWHGLLLPGEMDGVPGLNNFPGIAPTETFTYRFKVRQAGTYWYHAHSDGQEQDGHYGAIVIHPKAGEVVQADRDYVVLLSDLHYEDSATILANLKRDSDYYQNNRRTVGDFFTDVRKKGFFNAIDDARRWGEMRMLPTDLADVSGYTFLINGQDQNQNWTGLFNPGEKIRIRFINAAAMSFFDVRIPGLSMTVIASDGQNVEPITVDEFRFGVAETYDVIVTPTEHKAYTIVAEPIDRNGFAQGTLAPHIGMRGEQPVQRPRALLTMADMSGNPEHAGHNMSSMEQSNEHKDHGEHMQHAEDNTSPIGADYETGVSGSGWAQHGEPEGARLLSYKDLRYLGEQDDLRLPQREIEVRLGGSMERYIWTINGQKYADARPIELEYGERVRLIFINETMMAHPMHLHGMFVQLENGQPMHKLPNKHTVVIAPGDSYSTLLTADEVGEWAFHCHLLYHMMSGMMNEVVVARLGQEKL